LEPKVLTNAKRYTIDGEKKLDRFNRNEKGIITDNLIIKGNNLLALHTLKKEFEGKVKLIYIDPPFNTGDDEFKYNDRFSHSSWLTFIKNRLEIAKKLLSVDGILCVHIGNEEVSYLQIIIDEIFGKENYLNHITMTTNDPSGFKATSSKIFSTANHILIYSRTPGSDRLNKIYIQKQYDEAYKYVLLNPNDNHKKWKYALITDFLAKEAGFKSVSEFKRNISTASLKEKIADFAENNKNIVFRTAAIGGGALAKRKDTVNKSKGKHDVVFQHPNEDVEGFYILNGEQIIFWANIYREIDGQIVPSEALTDVWTDIGFTGIANEGGVKLKNGKKPEKLLKRIIDLCTKKGDIVLDFFSGSGTSCAVSHKMGRRYIGIEQLDYGENDSVIRLNNVIKGDKSGISEYEDINWQGGGSFVYLELKKYNESFIEKIEKAKDTNALLKIWEEMKKRSFLNYNVDIKKQDEHIEDFKKLTLKQQKEHLCELLDKNQLYVNLSSMNDKDFACTDEEKRVTKDFYGIKE